LLLAAVVISATPAVASAQTGNIAQPLFATPNGAAYCGIPETMAPENPVLMCWTPNDGFVASIQWDQCCARPNYGYSRRLKGYYPRDYRSLPFGRQYGYRCSQVTDSFAERCGSGVMIFFCSSKRDGLRCYNTQSKRGFWIGRYRGYRTVTMP
jgi:hypothetical protein